MQKDTVEDRTKSILERIRREYVALGNVYNGRQTITLKAEDRKNWYDAMVFLLRKGTFSFTITNLLHDVVGREEFLASTDLDFFVRITEVDFEKVRELYHMLYPASENDFCTSDNQPYDSYTTTLYCQNLDPDYIKPGFLSIEAYITVTIDGTKYNFRNKYEQRPEKILRYIAESNLWGKKITRPELAKANVLDSKSEDSSLKTIFRKSQFMRGALQPFAIIEKDYILLKKIVELNFEQRQRIVNDSLT